MAVKHGYVHGSLATNAYDVTEQPHMNEPDMAHNDIDLDPDVRAHLQPGDSVTSVRHLASRFRKPPLSAARALLLLGRVDRLEDLGEAGPLHAATTADSPVDADPELRKFEAVFGRDALRVNDFIGSRFPRLRRVTLNALAEAQGVEYDEAREEEPGKIVHEWRDAADPVARDITARNGWGWPYYGAVDTTPLYIIALASFIKDHAAAATTIVNRRDRPSLTLAESLADAITWLVQHLDRDPDGLLAFRRLNPRGIENQTWRDSWDSLSHADGTLPNHDQPVATLDLQALSYDALAAAAAHIRSNESHRPYPPSELEERARQLRKSVMERFWIQANSGNYFAAAIEFTPSNQERRPLRSRISDMGHLLTSHILDGDDVRECRHAVVRQLFSPGLLCSAGIRSLHSEEARYWPGGYHTGTAWLWQSLHIANGLERHGFVHLAVELRNRCDGIHRHTGLFPEFARGDDDSRSVLNDRIVDIWQDADNRNNRLEQPPQEVQAWTAAGHYAMEERAREQAHKHGPETSSLELDILETIRDRMGRPHG
jgi:glycogen debranching enzyme